MLSTPPAATRRRRGTGAPGRVLPRLASGSTPGTAGRALPAGAVASLMAHATVCPCPGVTRAMASPAPTTRAAARASASVLAEVNAVSPHVMPPAKRRAAQPSPAARQAAEQAAAAERERQAAAAREREADAAGRAATRMQSVARGHAARARVGALRRQLIRQKEEAAGTCIVAAARARLQRVRATRDAALSALRARCARRVIRAAGVAFVARKAAVARAAAAAVEAANAAANAAAARAVLSANQMAAAAEVAAAYAEARAAVGPHAVRIQARFRGRVARRAYSLMREQVESLVAVRRGDGATLYISVRAGAKATAKTPTVGIRDAQVALAAGLAAARPQVVSSSFDALEALANVVEATALNGAGSIVRAPLLEACGCRRRGSRRRWRARRTRRRPGRPLSWPSRGGRPSRTTRRWRRRGGEPCVRCLVASCHSGRTARGTRVSSGDGPGRLHVRWRGCRC